MKESPDDVARLYRDLLRARSPAERLEMAADLFDFARECALSGLRARGITDPVTLQVELFLRLHGRDFSPDGRARVVERLRAGGAGP